MAVIAEFHVAGDTLLLSPTLQRAPGMVVKIEQHTAGADGLPIFFFWAFGGDYAEFEAGLETDHTVREADVLDERDGQRLYRVAFTEASHYAPYRETFAKIIELTGTHDGWQMKLRFPDREAFIEYRAFYDERDVSFRLDQLYKSRDVESHRRLGLTPAQGETVRTAFERGYYEEPRATSLDELAGELDISSPAVAGRLRRAHATLIASTLMADPTPPTLATFTVDRRWK